MSGFRVWAPDAQGVELVTGERRLQMRPEARGWFSLDVPDAGHGTDYRFSVDGRDPLPDPRSPWQPEGVHGPSRTVDHSRFHWSDDDWRGFHLPSAIFYEVHVGTFTRAGTFEAAIEKLDHLVELGVSAVELMPVNQFPGRHGWGYDGVDLYAPHQPYGGPEGLKRLVDACHARGLGVVLDVVYNHLGPAGNYLAEFGPYFTDRYGTPWGDALNLDGAGSDEVRAFLIENALMWLEDYHFDGLRLDAVHAILDGSAVHLLEEMAERVEELAASAGRPLHLIAESDLNDPRLLRAREAGGYGLGAQWSDDFHHALHAALTGERSGYYVDFGALRHVAAALERAWVFDGRYSEYRDRRHGRPPRGLRGTRFLGYLQNHDQVGNRARGERASHLMSPGLRRIGAALVLTSPFVPMLFQGEEWGASTPFQYFTDHHDPELGRAVSEGRRREFAAFGWEPDEVPDPQDPATFERSRLDWDEVDREEHRDLLEWHRELIRLRRRTPALTDGRLDRVRARVDDERRTLVVERGPVVVLCNLSFEPRELAGPEEGGLVLRSTDDVAVDGARVVLPPESVAIVSAG